MTIINSVIKGKQPVIDTLNVTPTTSAQTITAPQGTDGYSPVNVSAVTSSIDANIVAGNIKKDVQILGVTGSYEGTTPTGTKSITANGVYDVTDFASADVQVPTTAPAYYIEKTKDANGKAGNGSHLMDFSTFADAGDYVFAYAYYQNTNITGTPDFSGITTINGTYACQSMFEGCTGLTGTIDFSNLVSFAGEGSFKRMFYGCTGITGVDLSNLTNATNSLASYAFDSMFYGCTGITGNIDLSNLSEPSAYGFQSMFRNCTGITSVDLSGLVFSGYVSAFANMFYGCTSLTTVNLGNLQQIGGHNSMNSMFYGCSALTTVDISKLLSAFGASPLSGTFQNCTSLTSVDLGSLVGIFGLNGGANLFYGCTNLTSVNLQKLAKIYNIATAFRNCTSLTSLSFPNLAYTATNLNAAFANTLQGVTGCTVHFPAEWQTTMSSWSNITNGMGGTNTTILFDLPNVITLDLSHITSLKSPSVFYQFASSNYFPNITTVDLSGLTEINANNACYEMFGGCAGITTVNMGNLTSIAGNGAWHRMFISCTGITSVDLSSLVNISGASSMMFNGCTSLGSFNFYSLKEVSAQWGLQNCFVSCTSLTDVKFPALKTIVANNVFAQMLEGVTGCTVHFPSNMSTAGITVSEISGTGTTILYDLPATNILTGADTKEYERNPKYDTATALAWRINGTMPNTTTYYTSGLTDPTVGTTIYSDSACTIAETTVGSIS